MIIFISSLLCTIQLVLQLCNCLNLIDLQQSGAAHSPEWKLESRRPPAMYERVMAHTLPRKREKKSNFRRYSHGNKKPHNKILFKASRRTNEDERDANLKNKLASLVAQTMHGTEEVMKEIEPIRQQYREEESYKAGFVLSMLKKSRDVVNELFNVAIKHRDEWQALEQLKIFEIIVHTNIDTKNLLKLLIDIQSGREVDVDLITSRPTTQSSDKANPQDKPDDGNMKPTDNPDDGNMKPTDNPDDAAPTEKENSFVRLGFQSQY